MIGTKINKWTILEEAPKDKWGTRHYNCKCECGVIKKVNRSALLRNHSSQCRACGYLFKKTVQIKRISEKSNNYKHGYNRTPTYKVWQGIKERCNPDCKAYYNPKTFKWYGAKGIKVCERWMKFDNFVADMGERPCGMQIDRIDNNKGYEPSNCRWATPLQNNRNRDYVKNK